MSGPVLLIVVAALLWPPGAGRPWRRGPEAPAAGPASARGAAPGGVLGRWRHPAADEEWVADLAEVVVVGLDAGLDLPRAVLAAARSPTVARCVPWLEARLEESVARGQAVADCVGGGAGRGEGESADLPWGPAVLDVLARAWRLSERSGASASATTAAAAAALRAARADRQRAVALAAGPRASMWLLTALPLAGPAVGAVVGVGPARLYVNAAAQVSAVVGVALTLTGWLWARRLLRRAARPGTTAGGPR